MEKRIFLTGPAGIGKSRLIREALGEKIAGAGGFVMSEETGPNGYAVGYVLRPAAAAGGVEGLEGRPFLDCRSWPPQRDNEAFRDFGARLLREALYYPFAVLDEIGGYETLIPEFEEALEALLQSGLPLIGALKTPEEAEQWRRLFGLGERCSERVGQLRAVLGQDGDTRIIDLRETAEGEALSILRAWRESN